MGCEEHTHTYTAGSVCAFGVYEESDDVSNITYVAVRCSHEENAILLVMA